MLCLIVSLCLYKQRKYLNGQRGRAVRGAGRPVAIGERVAVPFKGGEWRMLPVVHFVPHHRQ